MTPARKAAPSSEGSIPLCMDPDDNAARRRLGAAQ